MHVVQYLLTQSRLQQTTFINTFELFFKETKAMKSAIKECYHLQAQPPNGLLH